MSSAKHKATLAKAKGERDHLEQALILLGYRYDCVVEAGKLLAAMLDEVGPDAKRFRFLMTDHEDQGTLVRAHRLVSCLNTMSIVSARRDIDAVIAETGWEG